MACHMNTGVMTHYASWNYVSASDRRKNDKPRTTTLTTQFTSIDRASWSLFAGAWSVLEGSFGVLESSDGTTCILDKDFRRAQEIIPTELYVQPHMSPGVYQ